MEVNENDYVTAIVSSWSGSDVVQGKVLRDKQVDYILNIAGIEVEDYDERYKCYFKPKSHGGFYVSLRVLEIADSKENLKIDPSAIDLPEIKKAPMADILEMGVETYDIDFYNDLLTSFAVLYDLYNKHGSVEKAQEEFVNKVVGDNNAFIQSLIDSLEDFKDDFGIDGIYDEHGNKIV